MIFTFEDVSFHFDKILVIIFVNGNAAYYINGAVSCTFSIIVHYIRLTAVVVWNMKTDSSRFE